MNRFLLILGGLLVGILAALFVVPAYVDWNRYRGSFEEEATRLLGRDVRVGGRVNLRLLPTPYIQFEKVRIADTKGGIGEPLFRADDLTIWLSVGPLFSGALEASTIEVKRPVVTLVLDDQGSGNWSDLASAKPTSAFIPASVALNAVRITDGRVSLIAPGGAERLRLEHINGEFAAASLTGPFKLDAAFAHNGAPREIRLSTAAPEADGSVRFKGTVRTPASRASLSIDGRLHDILNHIRADGEIKFSLPIPPAPSAVTDARATEDQSGVLEIRSPFLADTAALELAEIALSFEQTGPPQLATGKARLAWRRQSDLELQLTSKWLDLDRLSGAAADGPPLATLGRLARSAERSILVDGRMAVRLDLEQATLGGEVVSGFGVVIEREGNSLRLASLSASLPGNSQIMASGSLHPERPEALFEGEATLRGASLGRLLAWGARGFNLAPHGHDGSFLASGRLRIGEADFDGRGLVLQAGNHRLVGDVAYTGRAERKLTVSLDGSELDITPLTGQAVRPLDALRALIGALSTAEAQRRPESERAIAAIRAQLRVGRLVAGETVLSDVAADLSVGNGSLSLSTLRIGLGDESFLEVRGDIADLATNGQRGVLSGRVVAETAKQIADVARFLDLPPTVMHDPARARALAPLRLAGRIGIGEKGPQILDIQLDGQAGDGRIAGSLVLDRKAASWRDAAWDAALTIEGRTITALWAQQLPVELRPLIRRSPDAGAPSTVSAGRPARLLWRAIGSPSAGLASVATLDLEGLVLDYQGQIRITDTGGVGIAGTASLSTPDLGRALTGLGYRTRTALAGLPLAATLGLSGGNEKFELGSIAVTAGDTRFTGALTLEPGSVSRLNGRLAADRLSLPWLLDLVSIAGGADPPSGEPRRLSTWPAGTFDLIGLAPLDIAVTIAAERLELAPSLVVRTAQTQLIAAGDRVGLVVQSARALDGTLAGDVGLVRTPAGARARITLSLKDARLEAIAAQGGKPPSGRFGGRLELEGSGFSPQGVVAALSGRGEVMLSEITLPGLGAAAPRTASEALLAIRGELAEGGVKRQVEMALDGAELRLPPAKLVLQVTDGIIRAAPQEAKLGDGVVSQATSVDLGSLRFDSEWRLAWIPARGTPEAGRPPLPPITVIYTGSLARLPDFARSLQIDAFEREITVRKYERDVEELERVRREDEERARQEAERRRLLEQTVPAGPAARPEAPPAPPPRPRTEPQKQTSPLPEPLPRLPRLTLIVPEPPPLDRLRQADPAGPASPAETPASNVPAADPGAAALPQVAAPVTKKVPGPRGRRNVFDDLVRGTP